MEFDKEEVRSFILNYLEENGPSQAKAIMDQVKNKFQGITTKVIENIHTGFKLKGIIESKERGIYSLAEKKKTKAKIKPAKEIKVKKTFDSDIIFKKEEMTILPEETIEQEIAYHHYTSGDAICFRDDIKLLPADEASHEDDILLFDAEYAELFGSVVNCDEGSNMLKIKINRDGREILVYPHWIKLVKRGDK